MEIRKTADLKPYDRNPRSITKEGFERLKTHLLKGQHSTLLVMADGTVLGGNMRLKAMQEMGIQEAKTITIDFAQEPEGWYAILDGEPIRAVYYPTREQAMFEYSLSHNERSGYYDEDLLANMEFDIDWKQYSVDFKNPETLSAIFDKELVVSPDNSVKLPTIAICPKCGHSFDPHDSIKSNPENTP